MKSDLFRIYYVKEEKIDQSLETTNALRTFNSLTLTKLFKKDGCSFNVDSIGKEQILSGFVYK